MTGPSTFAERSLARAQARVRKHSGSYWPGRKRFALDVLPPGRLLARDGQRWILHHLSQAERAALYAAHMEGSA